MEDQFPKKIASQLKDLFLCCSSSMVVAIDTLVKAAKFKQPLEVAGRSNPGYFHFVGVADQLGVEVVEAEIKANEKGPQYAWVSDRTATRLRALVPDITDREGDFHVMFPFCFEFHVRELRKHEPGFSAPLVDNLYLLLIWSEAFGSMRAPLSARILKDLLAWESSEVRTAQNDQASIRDEIRTTNRMAMQLSESSQMYLGFCRGQPGFRLSTESGLAKHPFNDRTQQFVQAASLTMGSGLSLPPWLVRNYQWKADETAVILKNAWIHHAYSNLMAPTEEDKSKVGECLKFRLSGSTENEISSMFGFSSQSDYEEWLRKHFLDLDSRHYRHPIEDWLTACQAFNIEPSSETVQALSSGTSHLSQSFTERTAPAKSASDDPKRGSSGFKHSVDYRAVVSTSGRQHSLTPKQAQVVQMLHEAVLNTTMELSQALIIQEVYGDVKSNNLKKLFSDNEIWDDLIEAGKRKGLIRLRLDQADI